MSIISYVSNEEFLSKRSMAIITVGLFKTCVGTAVLSMPKALKDTGIILFAGLLFGFSLLAQYGCYLVAKTLDIVGGEGMDPAKIGQFALGKWGKYLTLTMCFLDPWGSTVAFFSTLLDIVQPLLQEKSMLGTDSFWTHKIVIISILALAIFPLTLYTKMGELAWVNILGIISLIAFAIGVFVETVENSQGLSGTSLGNFNEDAVVALTVIAFAYDGCQLNVFPFYRDIPRPRTQSKGTALTLISVAANALGALCYLAVAYMGYATYRDDTDDDVLNNMSNGNFIFVSIKVFFALSLLFTIPLTLFECTAVLREHVFSADKYTNAILNFFLVGSAAIVASVVPGMYAAFAYVGATTATAWTMILPPLWYIYTVQRAYSPDFKGINVNADSDDEEAELAAVILTKEGLPPPPAAWEMACAWVFLIVGSLCVPFFVYITALN